MVSIQTKDLLVWSDHDGQLGNDFISVVYVFLSLVHKEQKHASSVSSCWMWRWLALDDLETRFAS